MIKFTAKKSNTCL